MGFLDISHINYIFQPVLFSFFFSSSLCIFACFFFSLVDLLLLRMRSFLLRYFHKLLLRFPCSFISFHTPLSLNLGLHLRSHSSFPLFPSTLSKHFPIRNYLSLNIYESSLPSSVFMVLGFFFHVRLCLSCRGQIQKPHPSLLSNN